MIVTVDGVPPISGIATVCSGFTTTLTNTMAGGTWTSSDPSVASVSSGGIVTGVTAGTALVTYSYGCGYTTKLVTVNTSLGGITGTIALCAGNSSLLSNSTPGGTWSSIDVSVATVATSGSVTGVSAGTAFITYATGTCADVTTVVTVSALPSVITGISPLCPGNTATLSCSPASGAWSTSDTSAATIGTSSGVLTGVAGGTARITYTLPTGCRSTSMVSVYASPATITGPATLCAGASTMLISAPSGGTWSSGSSTVTVASVTGVVTGVAIGAAVISYTLPTGCYRTHSMTITSSCSGTPTAGSAIATTPSVFTGVLDTVTLTGAASGCGITNQWQSSPDNTTWSNISGATNSSYVFTAATSKYYRCAVTCVSAGLTGYSASSLITVNFGILAHSTIADTFCSLTHFRTQVSGTTTLYTLKTWYGDNNIDLVSIPTTSLANNYHTYSMPGIYTVKQVLYYSGSPVDSITFSYEHHACQAIPVKLFNDVNGNGTYDAGDYYNMLPVTIKIDSAGVPVDTVTATSGFYYNAFGGVGTVYAFSVLSLSGGRVVSAPSSGVLYQTILSSDGPYTTKYFGFSCTTVTGFDLSVNSVAIAGRHTQKFTITVTNNYCSAVSPVVTMTFSPKYTYIPSIYSCSQTNPSPTSYLGNTVTWNLTSLAANSSRVITAFIERPASLPWLIPGDTVHTSIMVDPTSGDVDPGNNVIIRGDTIKSSFDPNIIEVAPEGAVLPCTQLQYAVQFENDGNDTAHNIYVLDTLSSYLDPGTIIPVTASATMNIAILHVGSYNIAKFEFPEINLLDSSHHNSCNGMFIYKIKAKTSLADGTAITNRAGIYFDDNPVVLTNKVTNTIGINPITGPASVCVGSAITLADATPSGTWSVGAGLSMSTVSGGAAVTGLSVGTSTVSYTVTNACASRTATKPVSVITIPSVPPVVGFDSICSGFTGVLTDALPSGIWMSSSTGVATVSTTGIVSGVASGTAIITYQVTNSCGTALASKAVTVSPTATPSVSCLVAAPTVLCEGVPITFTPDPVFPGLTPVYLWRKNGTIVSSGSTYTTAAVNGDVVNCLLVSDIHCKSVDTAVSPGINITADTVYTPSVTITAAPGTYVASTDSITFTATTTGAGPSPSYQWYVNGGLIVGATNSVFIAVSWADGDSVSCSVTGTGACGLLSSAYKAISVSAGVSSLFATNDISIFPNPNPGVFAIRGHIADRGNVTIEVRNVVGQLVSKEVINVKDHILDCQIHLESVPNGLYIVAISNANTLETIKCTVSR
jgi:uncharacterized repeat protein (TIGR01451 family)